MANRVKLDNVDHARLRVAMRAGPDFGHAINQVLLVPQEFEAAQREFPIFLRRDDDGRFQAVAILGFDRDENLFLGPAGWTARYMPAVLRRGPFFIGPGGDGEEPAVYADLDDPRIGETDGEPLFRTHGGSTPLLEEITRALHTVAAGLRMGQAMFAAFEALQLIQPVDVEVRLDDGLEYRIGDVFTVPPARLGTLGGGELERLNRAGFLDKAFYIAASTENMNRLIELKIACAGKPRG